MFSSNQQNFLIFELSLSRVQNTSVSALYQEQCTNIASVQLSGKLFQENNLINYNSNTWTTENKTALSAQLFQHS